MYRAYKACRTKSGKGTKKKGKNKPKFKPGRNRPIFETVLWLANYSDSDEEVSPDVPIKVEKVDFRKRPNQYLHHTSRYSVPELVVRRGQTFKLKVTLDNYDVDKNRMEIQFLKGDRPQRSKGTLECVKICKDKATATSGVEQDEWYGYLKEVNGTELCVVIRSGIQASVGRYRLRIRIFDQDNKLKYKQKDTDEGLYMYILFNPWVKGDQVFLEDNLSRQEYVMNETGNIWVGSANSNKGRPWNFGQFSKHSLTAAVYLLDQSGLDDQHHGNASMVTRTISAMANNCNYNNGVLEGNWSGDYEGGVKPTAWIGSLAILEQYMKTTKTVKYGQCWVFSGITTTLCRALGIPCRSVTNFASAHDTDGSLTIDKHFYGYGENEGAAMDHMDDSTWNFHVWNEGWFLRPDLPDGYDGWQAFDATPQEASEGLMQCGPASVKAIKEGLVYLGYDCKFIFSEVNGDSIHWNVMRNDDMELLSIDTSSVGKNISTRSAETGKREDVTLHYKYKEGSAEERAAVKRASMYSDKPKKASTAYEIPENDVLYNYRYDKKNNGDFSIFLTIENTSADERNLKLKLTNSAVYYTGRIAKELSCEKDDIKLKPSEKIEKSYTFQAVNYLNEIADDAQMKIHIWSKVIETKRTYVYGDVFFMDKPDLVMEVSKKELQVGEEFTLSVTMKNPVDLPLTGGVLQIEGPGVVKTKSIPINEAVSNGFTKELQLTPKYGGPRTIIAHFNSDQLINISGMVDISVLEDEEEVVVDDED